jgi:hypothetical protein
MMRIIVVNKPFDGEPQVFTACQECPVPLPELAETYWKQDVPFDVLLNGHLIPPDERQYTSVHTADIVIFRPQVRGFIPAAWVAFTAAIGPTMTAILINVAVMLVGGMLMRLFSKRAAPTTTDVSPWQTQLLQRDGISIPRHYGRNRLSGNIIASWRSCTQTNHPVNLVWSTLLGVGNPTNSFGTVQKLNMLVATGEGPDLGNVAGSYRINEQGVANFGITPLEKMGTVEQTAFAGFTELPVEYQCGILATVAGGPVIYTVPISDMDLIDVCLGFSKGLVRLKQGGAKNRGVKIKIRLRNATGPGAWNILFEGWIVTSTLKPVYMTYRSNVAYDGGAPVNMVGWIGVDIEITKVDTNTHADGDNLTTTFDELYLNTINAIYSTAFTFPKQAMVFVQAMPSAKLNGSLSFDYLHDGAIVNTYDGATWTLQYSDNPAWVILDLVTQPVITGDGTGGDPYAINRYLGLPIAQVDLDALWAVAQYCDHDVTDGEGGVHHRHVFSGSFQSPIDVWHAVLSVCDSLRVAPVWDGQQLTFVIDEAGTPIQLFNVGNIKQDSFSQTYLPQEDRASEIEVRYRDEGQDYKSDAPIVVVDETRESLNNSVAYDLPFETRQAAAWRFGRYKMLQNKLLLRCIQFTVDTEALVCGVGDLFYFQHDVILPTDMLGGRVVSATANTITVNRDATLAGALSVLVRVFDPATGQWTFEDQAVAAVVGPLITLAGAWTIIPKRDDPWILGTATTYNKAYRITKLQLQENKQTIVSAIEYNADVYDADTDAPVLQAVDTSAPGTAGSNVSLPTQDGLNATTPDAGSSNPVSDVAIIGGVTWTSNDPGAGSISWAASDTEFPILVTYLGVEYAVADDDSALHYIYWDPTDPNILHATNTLANIAACGGTLFRINTAGTDTPVDVGYNELYDALSDLIGLSKADGNIIVGNGVNWVTESGDTARHSLGLGTADTAQFTNLTATNTVRANTAFNHNGTVGITDAASGAPTSISIAGGIVTAITKSTSAAYSMVHATFKSPAASAGIFHAFGYYDAPATDANLTQVSTTVAYGTANGAYGAHAFLVAANAGVTDAGTVSIVVSGTSITTAGVRSAADSEIIVPDITALGPSTYIESTKLWIGTVTYILTPAGGAANYSVDFNYGFAAICTLFDQSVTVKQFECEGRAGAADAGFNVQLLWHGHSGWVYSAAAFVPGGIVLLDMNNDYNTETELVVGGSFHYRRTGLASAIDGSIAATPNNPAQGVICRITTTANNAIETCDLRISYQ